MIVIDICRIQNLTGDMIFEGLIFCRSSDFRSKKPNKYQYHMHRKPKDAEKNPKKNEKHRSLQQIWNFELFFGFLGAPPPP